MGGKSGVLHWDTCAGGQLCEASKADKLLMQDLKILLKGLGLTC